MNLGLLITICLTGTLLAFCSAYGAPLEELELSFLSDLRFRFRHESKPRQCALYWKALDSKLEISDKEDSRPLIERVDADLLARVGELIKGRSKSLSEYLKDCATLLHQLQENGTSVSESEHIGHTEDSSQVDTDRSGLKQVSSSSEGVSKRQIDLERQVANLQAERTILQKELDEKTKQLKYDSVMQKADAVAVGVKEKALQKAMLKRNEELVAEVESLKQRIVSLEADALKSREDYSHHEEELREKVNKAELDLAAGKSNDCSTKTRELELLRRIGELEKELKTEKESAENISRTSLADNVQLRQQVTDLESRLRDSQAKLDANKGELTNSRQDLDSTRKELSATYSGLAKCKSELGDASLKAHQFEAEKKDLETQLSDSKKASKDISDNLDKARADWRKEKAAKEEALVKLERFSCNRGNVFYPNNGFYMVSLMSERNSMPIHLDTSDETILKIHLKRYSSALLSTSTKI